MFAAHLALTVVAAIAFAYAAVLNFAHNQSVAKVAERLRVPVSWQVPLGFLLGAGAVGLVTGFAVPALGTAAACGLVLYFLCAAGAHISACVRWTASGAGNHARASTRGSAHGGGARSCSAQRCSARAAAVHPTVDRRSRVVRSAG